MFEEIVKKIPEVTKEFERIITEAQEKAQTLMSSFIDEIEAKKSHFSEEENWIIENLLRMQLEVLRKSMVDFLTNFGIMFAGLTLGLLAVGGTIRLFMIISERFGGDNEYVVMGIFMFLLVTATSLLMAIPVTFS